MKFNLNLLHPFFESIVIGSLFIYLGFYIDQNFTNVYELVGLVSIFWGCFKVFLGIVTYGIALYALLFHKDAFSKDETIDEEEYEFEEEELDDEDFEYHEEISLPFYIKIYRQEKDIVIHLLILFVGTLLTQFLMYYY